MFDWYAYALRGLVDLDHLDDKVVAMMETSLVGGGGGRARVGAVVADHWVGGGQIPS